MNRTGVSFVPLCRDRLNLSTGMPSLRIRDTSVVRGIPNRGRAMPHIKLTIMLFLSSA